MFGSSALLFPVVASVEHCPPVEPEQVVVGRMLSSVLAEEHGLRGLHRHLKIRCRKLLIYIWGYMYRFLKVNNLNFLLPRSHQ